MDSENIKELCGINGRLINWKLNQQWIEGTRIKLTEQEQREALKMASVLRGEIDELENLARGAVTDAPLRVELTPSLLSGLRIFPSPIKGAKTRFIRLPRELWRSAGKCSCDLCKGAEGFWDTLAVQDEADESYPRTYTVHYPELQTKY